MGANEDLIASLLKAVDTQPEDVPLRIHLTRLLLLSGRYVEACSHAEEALNVEPGNPEASELLLEAQGSSAPVEPIHAGAEPVRSGMPERPGGGLTLNDVAGLEHVKTRLTSEFLAPARNPELAAKYGKSARGGLLLYGPPGCGKTYIARALAGELGAIFLAVDSATVVSALPGASASSVREIFNQARRRAPSLIFFDEVDAVAPRRASLRGAGWLKGMVNQLLSELDGFADNTGLFVVGATNAPWDIDTAMRRPGRFDRTVAVLPPDTEARVGIFKIHLANRPAASIDYQLLAEQTDGFSGADIVHAIEEAAGEAFTGAMDTGKEILIDTDSISRALIGVRPSIRAWMEEAKNWVMFANLDGSLDDLADWMRANRIL